jgi:hypothetical protein
MPAQQQITPASGVEAFLIGYDADDNPILKAVCDMSAAEQLAAMAHALAEFEAALEAIAPYEPLVAANYLPDDLGMARLLADKCLAVEEVRARMERLGTAVVAMGVH